jgi:hypothetical protein
MRLVTTYREVGQTRATASGATVIGALFGHKASTKSVERALFNTNQRTLHRKYKVWVCGDKRCTKSVADQTNPNTLLGVLGVGVAIVIGLAIVNGDDEARGRATSSVALGQVATTAGDDYQAEKISTPPVSSREMGIAMGRARAAGDGAVTTGQVGVVHTPSTIPNDAAPLAIAREADARPKPRSGGTCYLKPGSTNVVVTDWDDKMACVAELGLITR